MKRKLLASRPVVHAIERIVRCVAVLSTAFTLSSCQPEKSEMEPSDLTDYLDDIVNELDDSPVSSYERVGFLYMFENAERLHGSGVEVEGFHHDWGGRWLVKQSPGPIVFGVPSKFVVVIDDDFAVTYGFDQEANDLVVKVAGVFVNGSVLGPQNPLPNGITRVVRVDMGLNGE